MLLFSLFAILIVGSVLAADKVREDSHYKGGEAMRSVDMAVRGVLPDPVRLL